MIAAPGAPEHDAGLAAKAERIERQFHAFNAFGTGMNANLSVPLESVMARAQIEAFLKESSGWDFEAYAGVSVPSVIGSWAKAAGAYAGVGAAADAFRYGTLRDQGADCELVDQARESVLADLDGLHLATAITGVPGVIARAFARTDLPGDGERETTPLFDGAGNPLPVEKNNGTWRADNSGQYPDYVWEDSCSRDMMLGWAMGYAGVWEVIRLDPSIPDELKKRLQADAAAIARSLRKVGAAGYDLEILDADGRVTYFGYLNENAIDKLYFEGAQSGFQGIVALGIVGAFASVAEDEELDAYLHEELVAQRKLDAMARDNMFGVDAGAKSNYSNYNMAFQGGFLAHRHLCQEGPREVVRAAIHESLYARPGEVRQPIEQKQTFYDFVHASAAAGATAEKPLGAVDEAAVARGLETLGEFPDAPFWEEPVVNCDEAEIASTMCIAIDGTPLQLLGAVGHNDELVSEQLVPMRTRPRSDYFWRSNPYQVNSEADGTRLLPASDFRLVYWMGRWMRR